MAQAELVWNLIEPEPWADARPGLETHGGLMIPTTEPLQVFQPVTVVIRFRGALKARVEGQVVQLADGQAAVMFDDATRRTLLGVSLQSEAAVGSASAPYEALSKPEKIKLARQGNADARRRVLRDPDQSLHAFLLSNPGLTANEVAGWFRGKLVPRGLIEQIAKRTDLASHPQVMEAMVYDPRTPMPIALKLLPRLPVEVCRRIAKAGNLRAQIVSAARKRVIG